MDYLALISSIFYILAVVIASNQLLASKEILTSRFLASISIALITHCIWLYEQIFIQHGQDLQILNVVSAITFIMALLSTIITKRLNTGALLPIVYGFTVVNFLAVNYLPSHYISHLESHPQIGTHIILALLAYSILTIASLLALQLAYLDYRLKNHKLLLTSIKMPPIMTLEKTLFQFIFIGFIFLSFTLLTGFIFLEDMFAQGKAHKTILSIIAWIIYTIILWGHYKHGWRGRLMVYITIIGSSLLTLAYFGSRFVREIILN
ncbi:MAG: cytochrome c biogenesis protein CcsA [Psychromonas sp.]